VNHAVCTACTPSTRSAHDVRTAGAHVDGDGEGDGEREGEVTASAPADAEAKKPSRATRRSPDFHPSAAHVALANERGVDLRNEWAKFCDWCDANGKTYKDWDAGLRNWIRNARPTAQTGSQPTRAQQHLALARQLAEEERDQVIPFRQIGDGR
jgi:hypothetical protein